MSKPNIDLSKGFHPGCILGGFVQKKRSVSGFFSRRYVEIHGGRITWTKTNNIEDNSDVSVRNLAGAAVHVVNEDNKIVKKQSGLHIFMLFLAVDVRLSHVPPLIFGVETVDDLNRWVSALHSASTWQYYSPALEPRPPRLCGVMVIEVVSIENVRIADWGGKSDPYVVIEHNGMRARTTTRYDTLSTVYREILTIPVYHDDPNIPINVSVYDEDAFRTDDMLGEVCLPLHALGFQEERYWDSVSLKLVSSPPPGSGSGLGSDRFGSITLRTFYQSSRVTQFLPLEHKPMIIHEDGQVSPVNRSKDGIESPLLQNVQSPKYTDQPSPKSALPSSGGESPKSPMSDNGTRKVMPASEAIAPKDPYAFDYEFSIEMMKLQLSRVVRILRYTSGLKSVSYFLQWRDPRWTWFVYAMISWVALVEPGSFLMFFYAWCGKQLLEVHPGFGEMVEELRDMRELLVGQAVWLRRMISGKGALGRTKTVLRTKSVLGWDTSKEDLLGGSSDTWCGVRHARSSLFKSNTQPEFRVYECQRRRIAGAKQFLTTMVKAPASVAAAAASPLLGESEGPDTPHSGTSNIVNSVQVAARDLHDLFISFSGANLKPGIEAEWVCPNGVPLNESPATVMDGIKIKWVVRVADSETDPNGWEYARRLPGLDLIGRKTLLSPKSVLWGVGSFVNSLKLHRHWVRRRLWVGVPVRPAFEAEDPILLSAIVASTANDGALEAAAAAADKEGKGLFARYKKVMSEGKKLQMAIFRVTSKIEAIKNLASWKVGWISSIMFWTVQILLFLTLVFPAPGVLWLLLSLILLDQRTDAKQKMTLMDPFKSDMVAEMNSSQAVPELWKPRLTVKLGSYCTKLDEITTDFSGTVILTILQKTCEKRTGFSNVRLTLADLKDTPTLGMLLETIHQRAHNGNEDWWKKVKTTVHPKNLIKHHLVSDWEEFNPVSAFS